MAKSPSQVRRGLVFMAVGHLFLLLSTAIAASAYIRNDDTQINMIIPLELASLFFFFSPGMRRIKKGRTEFGGRFAERADTAIIWSRWLKLDGLFFLLILFLLIQWKDAVEKGVDSRTFDMVVLGAFFLLTLAVVAFAAMCYQPVFHFLKDRSRGRLKVGSTLAAAGLISGNWLLLTELIGTTYTPLVESYLSLLLFGAFSIQGIGSFTLMIQSLVASSRALEPDKKAYVNMECPICYHRFPVLEGVRIVRCPQCRTRGFAEKPFKNEKRGKNKTPTSVSSPSSG